MKFIEHSGAAIGAGRESLQDLEQQMIQTGAELLVYETRHPISHRVEPGRRAAARPWWRWCASASLGGAQPVRLWLHAAGRLTAQATEREQDARATALRRSPRRRAAPGGGAAPGGRRGRPPARRLAVLPPRAPVSRRADPGPAAAAAGHRGGRATAWRQPQRALLCDPAHRARAAERPRLRLESARHAPARPARPGLSLPPAQSQHGKRSPATARLGRAFRVGPAATLQPLLGASFPTATLPASRILRLRFTLGFS